MFVIFWCYPKVGSLFVSKNSDPKIIFRFLSRFFVNFWCLLKVCSLFASHNSEPKIIFLVFFSRFCNFFGVIQKLAHYSFQTILSQKYFSIFFVEKVMSISISELEKYEGSIVGSVEDVDC